MRRTSISDVTLKKRGKPMATIEVTLAVTAAGVDATTVTANGLELAVPNPQAAEPKDTVTWIFTSGPTDLKVVFFGVQFLNVSGGLDSSQAFNAQGPFHKPLSRSGNEISGTIAPDARPGRYLYKIHDGNNNPLNWLTLLPPIPPGQNFGGLDVPKTPPGG
jgi:hypothetical protein